VRERNARQAPALLGIGISGDMYVDDASGTYTGTPGALLVNPVSFIHAILSASAYGNETSFATGSQFGSFATARTHMDRWAQIADGASWDSTFELDDQVDVDTVIDLIRDGLPEIIVPRAPDGTWRAFVWLPRYGTAGADWWAANDIYSSTPLDPRDVLVDGVIAKMAVSDLEELVSRVKIEYDLDTGSGRYQRTASVTPTGSDDGYGASWPSWPSTGAGAASLSDWSETQYGRRELHIQLPFIHSPVMAVAVGWYLLARFYRPTVRMQFAAGPELLDLQPGHIFRWSSALQSHFRYPPPFWGTAVGGSGENADWETIYWRVQHAEVETQGGVGASMVVTAEWYPQYIGTEAGFGLGSFGGEAGVIGDTTTMVGEVIGG